MAIEAWQKIWEVNVMSHVFAARAHFAQHVGQVRVIC